MPQRVLVVEDEEDIAFPLVRTLEREGYDVHWVDSGQKALDDVQARHADVVILDLGLPDMDGLEVCRKARDNGYEGAIMIVTARAGELDRVVGLDYGADDYMAKPFGLAELQARIRAQVRRASGHARSDIECGPLRLDTKTARVTLDGQPIKLTSHEYRLLAYLMHHNERVVSRTELVEHLYEQDFDRDSNTIEVFIGRLRKKIPPDMIKTIRGLGYRLSREGDEN